MTKKSTKMRPPGEIWCRNTSTRTSNVCFLSGFWHCWVILCKRRQLFISFSSYYTTHDVAICTSTRNYWLGFLGWMMLLWWHGRRRRTASYIFCSLLSMLLLELEWKEDRDGIGGKLLMSTSNLHHHDPQSDYKTWWWGWSQEDQIRSRITLYVLLFSFYFPAFCHFFFTFYHPTSQPLF